MDEKVFRPAAALPKARPTLIFPPAWRPTHASPEGRELDSTLAEHDPPRKALEGWVNRPDW